MWDADPCRPRRRCRSDELKTEHLLGIEARLCELSAPPFRFLSLPAEIRNLIYKYHFAATKRVLYYDLLTFKDPPITRVSKQVRREAQPFFFGDCSFIFAIRCNYLEVSRKHEAGRLELDHRVRNCLLTAGDAASFRDLRIQVFNMPFPATNDRSHTELPRCLLRGRVATISIQTQPKFQYVSTRGFGYPPKDSSSALDNYATQIERTLIAAQMVAEKLRAREEFRGYTVDDLTQIAQAFRIVS